jgi:hypothetical protein
MKTTLKTTAVGICLGLMFIIDVPPEFPSQVQLVPKAHAIFGVRRRAVRRGVIVGSSMAAAGAASASTAASQAASAPPPSPPPAPPAATDKPLPLGTVVPSLPAGCTSTPVGGVNYFYCGGNFYRAAFQSNQLVYVTAKP